MRKMTAFFISLGVFLCALLPLHAATVQTQWGGDAEEIYDSGFVQRLMKHPGGGVCLFNMDLVENDAPGSGYSEKGVCEDTVWGKHRARKLLTLNDPRAQKAWLVLFTYSENPSYPLRFTVNGYSGEIRKTNLETYRWVDFPASRLKKGKNVIDLFCPEARSEEEGWSLYLARADEFEAGGGNPERVGETSFKSTDGGKTWKRSPFGPEGNTRAEYTVRLSLDRYVKTGWLKSPVIDLWRGDSPEFIVPLRLIKNLRLTIEGETPQGTNIEYYLRKGTNPSPFGEGWEPYEKIGEGPSFTFDIDGAKLNRRYIQFKAVLSTTNPLHTPILKSAHVNAILQETVSPATNIHVIQADNPPIRYSSIDWEWEKSERPEFTELRQRENLNEVIAGSRTEFNAQVRLLDAATKRFANVNPIPEYPGWDALSILNRIDKAGNGGMCIQLNNLLGGMCLAYGWQTRLVNIVSHEVCEVWNDEFAKWIYIDASSVNQYIYDEQTDEPLNLLELHKRYLDKYFPNRSIDWMNDPVCIRSMKDTFTVKQGSLTHHMYPWNGVTLAAHIRMVPRNNWYEKPYPRPLTHGKTWWPWNGYINWYDDRTPPQRQYSWFTDRPRDMWPDLNKVHVDATSGYGNDRLYLRFETYTPNFSHYEVNVDDTGWKKVGERWAWLLQSGRNTIRVRAVSQLGVKGKPTSFVLNHADAPLGK